MSSLKKNKYSILILIIVFFLSTLFYSLEDKNDIIDNYDFPISENFLFSNIEKHKLEIEIKEMSLHEKHSSFVLNNMQGDVYNLVTVQQDIGKYINFFIEDTSNEFFESNLKDIFHFVCDLYGIKNESDYLYSEYIDMRNKKKFQDIEMMTIKNQNYCVKIVSDDSTSFIFLIYSNEEVLDE